MHKELRVLFALTIFALLFASCATPPAPKYAEDTLFIVPVVLDRGGVGNNSAAPTSAAFLLKIDGVSDPTIHSELRLDPNGDYVFLRGLPPGRYVVREADFLDNNGKVAGSWPVNDPFVLGAGELTLFHRVFEYKIYSEANIIHVGIGEIVISLAEAKHLVSVLSSQGVLAHWALDPQTKAIPVLARALYEAKAPQPKGSVEFK